MNPITNELSPDIQRTANAGSLSTDGRTVTPAAQTAGGTPRVSQGNYQTVTASPNGTEVPNRPAYTSGLYVYAPAGSVLQGFIAPTGSSPIGPANGNQVRQNFASDVAVPIYLSGADSYFVTVNNPGAGSGSPVIQFQWVQR